MPQCAGENGIGRNAGANVHVNRKAEGRHDLSEVYQLPIPVVSFRRFLLNDSKATVQIVRGRFQYVDQRHCRTDTVGQVHGIFDGIQRGRRKIHWRQNTPNQRRSIDR